MTQEKARIPYFDFLRGIAILLVVSIHTFGLFPVTDNLWGEIKLLLSQVIQCAVPLFLAISGFFLAKKQAKYTTLLKRQIPRVYIPVLIWSLPFYIKALNGGYNPFTATVICLACGFSIYYFVAVIMQLYILSPVLYKFNKLGGVIFSCLITAIAVSFVAYERNIEGVRLPLVLYAGLFPVWLAFFQTGMWLGSQKNRDYKISPYVWTVVIALLLSYIEMKLVLPFHNEGVGLKLSSHIYSFALIMLLFSERVQNMLSKDNTPIFRFFVWLGPISFGIYLTHLYILSFLQKHDLIWGWFIDTAVVLLSTAFIIYLLNKILPSKISKYLGFR